MRKNLLCLVFALAAFGVAASTATAGELSVKIANGRATIIAKDVPVRQILAEWAKVGETKILNGEKVAGGPVTLELVDVPEKEALDVLLRTAAGYITAPRPANLARGFAVRPGDRPRDEPCTGSNHEPDAAAIRKPGGRADAASPAAAAGRR